MVLSLCWVVEFHDFWWLTLVPQHVQRSLVWWMQGLDHDYNWYVWPIIVILHLSIIIWITVWPNSDDPCITLDALNTTLGSLYQVLHCPNTINNVSRTTIELRPNPVLSVLPKMKSCFEDLRSKTFQWGKKKTWVKKGPKKWPVRAFEDF